MPTMGDLISMPPEAAAGAEVEAGASAAMAGSADDSLTEKTGWLVTYWAGPTAPAVLSVILKPSRSILKTATPFFFMRSMSVRISLMSTVEVGFLLK